MMTHDAPGLYNRMTSAVVNAAPTVIQSAAVAWDDQDAQALISLKLQGSPTRTEQFEAQVQAILVASRFFPKGWQFAVNTLHPS